MNIEIEKSNVFFRNWRRSYPLINRGEGVYLYDTEEKRYLDAIGGMFVVTIGYGVTEVAEAIAGQAQKLCFLNNVRFTNEPQELLASKLIEKAPTGMDRVFFVTSGSGANEVSFQIARIYHRERGKSSKYRFIAQWHNYYGYSVAAISMSGDFNTRRTLGVEPYALKFPHIQAPHCYHCPFGVTYPSCQLTCANELALTIEREGPDTIAAFIATPIIGGTGGAIVPPPGYFERIREICDFYDILFIADEVITGLGRLGKNFGIEHWDVIPDIITLGKTLGSGYASIGAVMMQKHIWDTFVNSEIPGTPLGFTYSGHPTSCAGALAVQNYLAKHNLIERAEVMGNYLKGELKKLADREALIGDVRGRGLFLGVELVQDRKTRKPFPRSTKLQEKIVKEALEQGVVIAGRIGTALGIDGDHISICPPLIITESECDEIVAALEASIKQVKKSLDLVTA